MRKYKLIALLLVFSFVQCFAQLRLGIRAGVNSNYIKKAEYDGTNYRVIVPKDATMGFHFGLVGQLQLFNFFVQPEILFSSNRNDIIITDLNTHVDELSEHKFNKLNIPLMLGYKFKALKLEAGPVGSVLLRSKSDLLEERGFVQNVNAMTWGYQAGIGLDVGKLALDLKYEGNFSKFGDGIKFGGQTYDFDQRTNQLFFGVGLFF